MSNREEQVIETLLKEERVFPPTPDFVDSAILSDPKIYEKGKDLEAFWAQEAKKLAWFKEWDQVLKWEPPNGEWFINGKLNASYNCLDRHLNSFRKNKAAIIWEGEKGSKRTYTFNELHHEVCKFASVLLELGVKKGDRVTIYLPMIPELVVAMLACARIGAPHSVVFAGFSATALAGRINDAQSKILITADGYYRRGTLLDHKRKTDEALRQVKENQQVIVVKRGGNEILMKEGQDLYYHELLEEVGSNSEPEPMDSEDMLFLMYTSGTTGMPKGIVHTTGGYLTYATTTSKYVFDLKEEDTYWCAADIGWITGHSYIVYGILSNGITSIMYEGAPDYPDKFRLWEMIERHRVNIFYTAPTAIRSFMKWGPRYPRAHDLSSLRLLGSVGEPINPRAWMWYHKYIGNEQCPIVDTWWQTETGGIMLTPLPGITKTKPGSVTTPFIGVEADILDEKGNPVHSGYLAITKPWPGMLRTIYNDKKRYEETYWSKWGKDIYFPGDGARKDEDGYFWILGRVDDVMNISGHRLSTMEIESALVEHEAVVEAAVIGARHEIKGQIPFAYVILQEGIEPSLELNQLLMKHVADAIGPIARPGEIIFTPDLPKTRSGKIMRRLLKDIANNESLGDTTTLQNPEIAESLTGQVKKRLKE